MDRPYKFSFVLSIGIIIFVVILGGIMNPAAVSNMLSLLPYIAVGVVVFVLVSLGVWIFSTKDFPIDSKKEPLIFWQNKIVFFFHQNTALLLLAYSHRDLIILQPT